jgi:FKBP-type peptidyl-prolyl cis-trans isomerase 2
MKKSLLIGLTLSSTLLLTACGNKQETPSLTETPLESETQNLLPSENEITMTCPEAIEAYLSTANLEGEGTESVQANDSIVVDYIGRLADGTVFDTSVESVAKACGTHNTERNYNQGLEFIAGTGQMIPGFDAAVIGMKLNQTKTVNIPTAEAYGEYNSELVFTVPTDGLDTSGLTEGMQIMTPDGMPATITKITNQEITLDYNSQLAGKDLIFDITLKAIN